MATILTWKVGGVLANQYLGNGNNVFTVQPTGLNSGLVTLEVEDTNGFYTAAPISYSVSTQGGEVIVPQNTLASWNLVNGVQVIDLDLTAAEFVANLDTNDELFVEVEYTDSTGGAVTTSEETFNMYIDLDADGFPDITDQDDTDPSVGAPDVPPTVADVELTFEAGGGGSFQFTGDGPGGILDESPSTVSIYSIADNEGNFATFDDMADWENQPIYPDYEKVYEIDGGRLLFKEDVNDVVYLSDQMVFFDTVTPQKVEYFTIVVQDETGQRSTPANMSITMTNPHYGLMAPVVDYDGNGTTDWVFNVGDTDEISDANGVQLLPPILTDDVSGYGDIDIDAIIDPDGNIISWDDLDGATNEEWDWFEKELVTENGQWYFSDSGSPNGTVAAFVPNDITDSVESVTEQIGWRFVDGMENISDVAGLTAVITNNDYVAPAPTPAPDNGGGDDGGGDDGGSPEPSPEPTPPAPISITPPPTELEDFPTILPGEDWDPEPIPELTPAPAPERQPAAPAPAVPVDEITYCRLASKDMFDTRQEFRETRFSLRDVASIADLPDIVVNYVRRLDKVGTFDDFTVVNVGADNGKSARRRLFRAAKTDADFIYNKRSDKLYFNANGEEAGFIGEFKDLSLGGYLGRIEFDREKQSISEQIFDVSLYADPIA